MERTEQDLGFMQFAWNDGIIPLEPLVKIGFVQGEPLTYAGRRKKLAEMTYFGDSIADTMTQQTEMLAQYDKIWHRMNVRDDYAPKIAVLQLKREAEREYGFEGFDSLTARGKSPDVTNYNLVHVRRLESPVVGEAAQKQACQKLYAELNNGMQHPYNYFGHSPSVSDIVVVRTDFETSTAYYVDRYGFVQLPENFLDQSMSRRIALDVDVFQERNALRQIREWQEQTPVAVDFLSADDLARLETLDKYLRPIEQLRSDRYVGGEIFLTEFAYDGEGYYHFEAKLDGYTLPGVFRVYDPANGEPMKIVSIENGEYHKDVLDRNWAEMETTLREVAQGKYDELTAHLVAADSRFVTLNGVTGEWRTVESRRIDGLNLFLMERERRDDDVYVPIFDDRIIADETGKPLLRGVSGFQQYIYEVSQPLHEVVIRAMKRDGFDYNEGIVEIGTEKVGFQKGDWDKPDTLMFFDNWQKAAEYVRENRARLLTPIEEVRGIAGVGVLAGSELSRGQVYEAVRDFEQNNLVEYPVINAYGNYEDKDFLYAAYDEYVAMSHYEELFPYRERFIEAVTEEVSRRENWGVAPNVNQIYNERLAEVYYAKQAGLTDAQIDGVIADGKRAPYLMRQIRKLYQAGYTQEQIDALTALEKTFAIDYAADFLRQGGNIEVVKAMPHDTDMTTAFYTLGAVTSGIISDRAAACIFEASHRIHSFNDREFAKAQRENPETANYRFTGGDFDYLIDSLVAMANPQGGNLDGETILATVNRWLEFGAKGQLREQPIITPEDNIPLGLANQFPVEVLETELDARDDTSVAPQNAELAVCTNEHIRDAIAVHERKTLFPERYADLELGFDGTAEDLYRRAGQGRIKNPDALAKIQSVLKAEGLSEEAKYVGVVREMEMDTGKHPYNLGAIKKDLMDGVVIDEIVLRDGLTLNTLPQGRDAVMFAISEQDGNTRRDGNFTLFMDAFISMTPEDFQRRIEETYFHAQEMTVEPERGEQREQSSNNRSLKTVEAVEKRIAEIDAERNEMYELQYRYGDGYMVDKVYDAKLYQEKQDLQRVLEVVANYPLTDVQAELDTRDDADGFNAGVGKDGLKKYSFYVLGHAETILQGQDRVLQDRVDLGENAIEEWEKKNRTISYEENRKVYELIRDKTIPVTSLARLIDDTLSGTLGKEWVAVESTDDYAEPGFGADLVDADIQNEDGTYGRVVEHYRIVVIGNDTSLQPLDNRVFNSYEDALASIADNPDYRVVSYDDIVHEAMNRRMAAKIPNRRENEMAEQETQQTAEPQEQETLYLFRHTHSIQMPENPLDNRPAYLFISHTLYTLNGDGEAVEVTNIYDDSEEHSTAKADARLAEFIEKFRAEHPDRTVAVIPDYMDGKETPTGEDLRYAISEYEKGANIEFEMIESMGGGQTRNFDEAMNWFFNNAQDPARLDCVLIKEGKAVTQTLITKENGVMTVLEYSAFPPEMQIPYMQGVMTQLSERMGQEVTPAISLETMDEKQAQEIIGSANAMLPADLGFMEDYASPGAHTQLREVEARAAIKRGVRVDLIARIEDYHGSHEDDYSKRRLTEQDVDEYYSAIKGNNQQNSRFSIYRGAAYLSPDYEVAKVDIGRLKKAVQYFTAQDRGEREATPGVEVDRAAEETRLYEVGGNYIHIQRADEGWDYTIYDASMKNLDGGQLTRPELDISAAYAEICELQRLDHSAGRAVPLSLLEEQEAPQQGGATAVVAAEKGDLSPKEKLQQQLEAGVRSVMDSEVFKNWLGTSSRMFTRQYSFQNAILVWLQKPDASYTMGYEAWKNYGRNVQQGAQGAKIFVPLMANEKFKGALFAQVKKGLTEQLAANPSAQVVSYRLGTSKLEFTLNRNNLLYGVRMDGKDRGQLGGETETKRFIERSVLGKIPYGFTVGTVFDVRDVAVPEYLWVKRGYTKDEVVKDDKGRPVKNRRGEVKIVNTPERQARFQPNLDTSIAAKDPEKMEKLFDACVAASERKGVPVYLRDKTGDDELGGGAKGYFNRMTSPEYPKGYIVIDKELEITERCAVLMHEMSHADLHGNLEALNQRMGEKVTRGMREVQAEASAFATASQFGISTDTSSFAYLAVYSTGYQLQEFQKSLEVIYKEAKELTADIKAELDLRGLNLDLTPKPEQPLEAETIKVVSAKYIDFATEQERVVLEVNAEMPELLGQASGNAELLDILRYQRENIDSRKEDVEAMIAAVDGLNKAESREEQQMQISVLDAAMTRIRQSVAHFESLSEFFIATNERLRGGLKVDFENDPENTLQKLSEDYPRLKELSKPQTEYICTSKFISTQYSKLLRGNAEEFVNKVCDRAEAISKVAARNGTFVEVNFCEQWTDKPIFENGTICHPKIAEKIIAASETQIQEMRREAESKGDYFPYAKCDITVYAQGEDGLKGWTSRVDIGDGGQTGLSNFLEQVAGKNKAKNEVLQQFTQAVTEKGAYKSKIYIPSKEAETAEQAKEKTAEQEREQGAKRQTVNKWKQQINSVKGQHQEQENTERAQKPGRTEKEQGG